MAQRAAIVDFPRNGADGGIALVTSPARSMPAGYAGVDNPLFQKEDNRMLVGDAKKMLEVVLAALKG
jgi:NAD/NADP transhydrogenase beta subunit